MPAVDCHGNGPDNDAKKSLPSENIGVILVDKADELIHESQDVFNGVQVEYSVTLRSDEWIWVAVHSGAVSILADEGPVHVFPPAIDIDIDEVDFLARIGAVTSNDAWRKEAAL
jgi:hypothetical protein